jgi:hypothetical protein
MKTAEKEQLHYIVKHLSPLVGKTVKGIVFEEGSESEFGEPIYGLKFSGGHIAFVLRDPEGNGLGHLEIIKE